MKRDAGFSLLEVIIALFILSTTAVGFMRVTQTSVQAAKEVEHRYLASIVADNKMVEMFSEDIPLRIGVDGGSEIQHGRSFDWERTISSSIRTGVLEIRIDVRPTDGTLVLASATALKAEPLS